MELQPQKLKSTHEQQLAEMEGLLSRGDLLVEDRLKIQLDIKRKVMIGWNLSVCLCVCLFVFGRV